MANFRSLEQIILGMLDYLRATQPELDTKPGTVARDLIDAPASEISKLYLELRDIQNVQSLTAAVGRNLDQLARNFGLKRNSGSPATGSAVLTVNTLDSNISIPTGTLISAKNGVTFKTISDVTLDVSKSNIYKANAIRLRQDLDLAGIADTYALEVTVEAQSPGTSGNIGKFSLTTFNIAGISNVVNTQPFSNGTNNETDDSFRTRILSVFAGSSVGTILGYINTLVALPSVVNAFAIEPGDPLMVRDGTDVVTNSDGEKIIVSSGTGGKVDLYVQGSILRDNVESYIYKDQSGKQDPTDPSNDFILGQRSINAYLDFQQKRKLLIDAGTLPFQPVEQVFSVVGSLSGPNFIPKFTDAEGQAKGSYELIKDSANYSGSPFGFDRLHFISNQIDLLDESISKGVFNGEDSLDYTDIKEISSARQNVVIANEHADVNSQDRSVLTLKHTPISVVNSIFNVTTGQRYKIENQNLDGIVGEENATGRVKISGGTLPTLNDILQVNYLWNNIFDKYVDFDNLKNPFTVRTAQDSIDWGFSNKIINEQTTVQYSIADGYHAIVKHKISRILNVKKLTIETAVDTDGNRKFDVANTILNIESVKNSSGKEIFFTSKSNGSFSGKEITLPTDAIYTAGENLTVRYNYSDVYALDGYASGSFENSSIYFQEGTVLLGDAVFANYVADVLTLLPATTLANLPAIGSENEFIVNGNIIGNQPVSNIYNSGNIVKNLRFAPTYLKMDLQGILNAGKLNIKGSTITKIEAIITVRRDGLNIDISDAVKEYFNNTSAIASGYVSSLVSIQKVTVVDDSISSFDFTYDVLNYGVKNNFYSNGQGFSDTTLQNYEVKLAATSDNTASSPQTGDRLKVIFYWIDSNTVERVTVSTSGVQYSKYKYVFVQNIYVDSGFVGLAGNIEGSVNITSTNQPVPGSNYFVSYSYTAPKEGERITVSYSYNRLISDATFAIENTRPVTADVLVRQASSIGIDVSLSVIPLSSFTGGNTNLIQSVTDTIATFLANQELGSTIDNDDIIALVHGVSGVDKVTLSKFNFSGKTGIKQSIVADKSQYLTAGTINVSIEAR